MTTWLHQSYPLITWSDPEEVIMLKTITTVIEANACDCCAEKTCVCGCIAPRETQAFYSCASCGIDLCQACVTTVTVQTRIDVGGESKQESRAGTFCRKCLPELETKTSELHDAVRKPVQLVVATDPVVEENSVKDS
jgi:hypothetical protein